MKRIIPNAFVYTILTITMLCVNVFASDYAENYTDIYLQNFEEMQAGAIDEDFFVKPNNRITAEICENELKIAADAVSYFAVNSEIDDVSVVRNSNVNKHGIEMCFNPQCYVTKMNAPLTYSVNGRQYAYKADVGGNGAVFFDSADSIKAIKQFTYASTISGSNITAIRTNASRFKVDENMFNPDDNVVVEVRYYTPDNDEKRETKIKIFYPQYGDSDNSFTGSSTYNIPSSAAGHWETAKFYISYVDFSKYHETSNTYNKHNLRIESTQDKELFIHSVSVYKQSDNMNKAEIAKATIKKQFTQKLLYGNYELSFDLKIPDTEYYDDSINALKYNSGQGNFVVSAIDSDGDERISIEYEIDNSMGKAIKIYANTSDGRQELYSGDIFEKELSNKIIYNMENNKYSVEISENGQAIVASELSYSVMHDDKAFMNLQYISGKAGIISGAASIEIDNIKVSLQDNLSCMNCAEDLEAIELNITNPVNRDFILPTIGNIHSSNISWISSDETVISVNEEKASVRCGETEKNVTLTPQISVDGKVFKGNSFFVRVASITGTYADIIDIDEAVVAEDNGDGTVNVSISIQNCGPIMGENVHFIVTSVNPVTKTVSDKKVATEHINSNYQKLNMTVSNLSKSNDDILNFYLWNDENVSLINNAPTPISNLVVTPKVTGIKVDWNKSYDDNGDDAISCYEIYRDGVLIGETKETTYFDNSIDVGNAYAYSVSAKDTNNNESEISESLFAKSVEMYYVNVNCEDSKLGDNSNGISLILNPSNTSVPYTVYDLETHERYTPRIVEGKTYDSYMMFATNKLKNIDPNAVTGEYRNVAVRITYLDNSVGNLKLYYNAILPENAEDAETYYKAGPKMVEMIGDGKWKTTVIYLEDAQFRNPSKFAGADFAIGCTNGDRLYIKKVEVIQTERFE